MSKIILLFTCSSIILAAFQGLAKETERGDLGIVKSLAHEGARNGITANAICPGYISTDMVMSMPEKAIEATISQIPTGRLGEPEEIARCVVFLASKESGFINGSTISANGAQFFV